MNVSRKPTAAFWTVVAVVLLPMLYVASMGPVMRLAQEGWIDRQTVRAIYAPIQWLPLGPVLTHALAWYVSAVWGVRLG